MVNMQIFSRRNQEYNCVTSRVAGAESTAPVFALTLAVTLNTRTDYNPSASTAEVLPAFTQTQPLPTVKSFSLSSTPHV